VAGLVFICADLRYISDWQKLADTNSGQKCGVTQSSNAFTLYT